MPPILPPMGRKATILAMLSKYGAEADVRLALGHHQIRKGAAELYARDTQSAPLRVLEAIDIRKGHFQPDQSRSGMFRKDVRMADQPGGQVLVTDIPLPAQEDGYSPGSLAESWNLETLETSAPPAVPEPSEAVDTISCDSDDSDSSSDSEADSCATETLEEQAKKHSRSSTTRSEKHTKNVPAQEVQSGPLCISVRHILHLWKPADSRASSMF